MKLKGSGKVFGLYLSNKTNEVSYHMIIINYYWDKGQGVQWQQKKIWCRHHKIGHGSLATICHQ